MADLLFEIGTEEMPAGYLEPGLEQLADQISGSLRELRLEPARVLTAGTPRRMVIAVQGIPESQPAISERIVGPPAKVAFDEDGNPTKAADGFARSRGVAVEDLKIEETDRGPYAVVELEKPGQAAAALLPGVLREATGAVSFPKSMRWEESGFSFARPIRSLLALLDDRVLALQIAGVKAGRTTWGHPFLAPRPVELPDASYEAYRDALREYFVVVDVAERREAIRAQIAGIMEQHGSELRDRELLEEVTNLVEHPRAVEGAFDKEFLKMPPPVVIAAMEEHQRYFPVWDGRGELAARFVTVSNRTEKQDELVRQGNERVLRARLEDARFYWERDSRRKLDELVPALKEVVFLAGLGDNLQRTERLQELGGRIAADVPGCSPEHVRRAARLCKADLLTGLVGEFPSLQGVVGRELALRQGEPQHTAAAIAEHYLPTGADSDLPQTAEGIALALADKLDVIVGCFSLGLLPKGSQDPYALRRNALGILLIIEDKGLELHLGDLLETARDVAGGHGIACDDEMMGQIREFFRDRLYHAALDRGYRHDYVRAVLSAGFDDVRDFWARLAALQDCAGREWWPALVELVDRTYRIQRDVDELPPVKEALFTEPLEKELAAALARNRPEVVELFEAREYVRAAEKYCSALAQLVHDFFEEVFVNVEDEAVRANRKSLCGDVYRLFADRFADLYLIETAE